MEESNKNFIQFLKLIPPKPVIEENIKNGEVSICALILQCYELLQSKVSGVDEIIDVILDKTWEDLNTGHWSSVPLFKRHIYSLASIMMVVAKVMQASNLPDCERRSKLEEALKAADRGLLLGGELRMELTQAAQTLTEEISRYKNSKDLTETSLFPSSILPEFTGVHGDAIPILVCPSLENFFSQHFNPRKPVKLKDCINHWPALAKWKDIGYLLKKAGERTVPIELGSKYDDSEWSQKLINFRQFVEQYVLVEENKIEKGYLAQHQLFLQIPELKDDIREPEFCCCSDLKDKEVEGDVDEGSIDINAWFGPKGTVSSLHFDPKHNLLAQVVGRKRVILYDPKYSDRLSPHENKLLFNTAQVDPENTDFERFPRYQNVPALETILHPGEMLYIPPTWWHHVRSLDISFSVSFWWM